MNRGSANWGTVAEVVSAIAIVLSLIFVGIQIRGNTINEMLSSYDRLHADLINWRMQVATNPETIRAMNTFLTSDARNDQPMEMGRMAVVSVWEIYERAYFARSYGRLGDAEWSRYKTQICRPRSAVVRAKLPRASFSDEFWRYAEQCERE